MRFSIYFPIFLAFMSSASGCARVIIHRTSANPPTTAPKYEMQNSVVFGLIRVSSDIDLTKDCSEDWETLTNEVKPLQTLLHVVTLNIYSPWNVEVDCTVPKKRIKSDIPEYND